MTDTVALAHDVTGPEDAPVAVLLGSLGASRSMWSPQVEALSDRFRVVAVDLRGHGGSPAPEGEYDMGSLADDVIRLLDELGARRVHLVGVSMGGAVAQTIALEHPERLESLVLMATAPKFGETGNWVDRAAKVRAEGTGALAEGVVGNWFTDGCFEDNPELPQRFVDGITATPDAGYASCCHAIAAFDSRARLANITAKTLVIAGEQDTSTALEVVRQLHEGIPRSTMATISPAKHLVGVEHPGPVNALLAQHWAG